MTRTDAFLVQKYVSLHTSGVTLGRFVSSQIVVPESLVDVEETETLENDSERHRQMPS